MKRERRLAEPGLKSCAKTQKVASQVSFSLITLVLSLARASPQLRDESLTIENKIDWFRRSDFGDVIGLTRLRRSFLLFPHSCWQDDLKTVFTKIHTQMINRYRIWRSLSRIRNITYIRSGLPGNIIRLSLRKHELELTAFILNWLIFGRVFRCYTERFLQTIFLTTQSCKLRCKFTMLVQKLAKQQVL